MECNKIQEKLSAYIEGIISSEGKILIDKHFESCQRCKESLDDLKKTIEYVQNLEFVEPPSWLTQKIMTKVRKVRTEAEPKKGLLKKLFHPLHIKLPIGAAATILIAVTAIYVFKTIQPEIKLAKAPSEVTMPQTLPPLVPKGAPHEVPSPIEKQGIEKKPEVLSGKTETAEEHVEFGEEDRVLQGMTVYVKDTVIAKDEIEKAVKAIGGDVIGTETFGDKDILTARLNSQKIEELNKKLQLIGEVKKKVVTLETQEGFIEIKIEIAKGSNQP